MEWTPADDHDVAEASRSQHDPIADLQHKYLVAWCLFCLGIGMGIGAIITFLLLR